MRTPATTTNMDRPVNLLRATTTCNTFYIFLSAAKAALLPFLTLFFRLIGLSALQTGIIMAAKTLTGFVWAPLWARCAVSFNKRRTVLVFSLLMMAAMYMSFIAVYYKVGTMQPCRPGAASGAQDGNVMGGAQGGSNTSAAGNATEGSGPGASVEQPPTPVIHTEGGDTGGGDSGGGREGGGASPGVQQDKDKDQEPTPEVQTATGKVMPVTPAISVTKKPDLTPSAVPSKTPIQTPNQEENKHPPVTDTGHNTHAHETPVETHTEDRNRPPSETVQGPTAVGEKTPAKMPTEGNRQSTPSLQPAPPLGMNSQPSDQNYVPIAADKTHRQKPAFSKADIDSMEKMMKKKTGLSFQDIKNSGWTAHELYPYVKKLLPEGQQLTEEDIQQIMDLVNSNNPEGQSVAKRSADRMTRTLNFTFFNDLRDKVGVLASTLEEKKLLLFIVVLLVVIFGEFFSSPVEKIADDAWFDFLERIDDMEKYGRQRYWGSLTFALVPIVVAAIVDYTPCKMMFDLHHFLLHFYVFGVFMIFTLFLAFYFPMPPPVKQKYGSKVGKGLRVICCDGRGLLFVVTLLVAGAVYSSFNNFLFWRLQDLGGSEVTMGLCVSIGAFAETPMLVFSNKLVRKLGNNWVVSLSLLVLALRVLYYGFLWTPWAVLPAEVTNAFTHTAMWYAVLSYDEFNVGSAMDRSIRSILSSIYFGLGFSLGSFLSGLVYEVYGASVLFWGASVVSGAWCLLYSVIQTCLPKKERVKYIKLLRKEDDESSEEDDWLEMALKDQ